MGSQRQQPTRLPCPWDSPGKNTGVGCHFLLQCMKVKSESEVACVQLLATPWAAAYHAPPSMGFSRQEYWSGAPLPSPIYSSGFPKTGSAICSIFHFVCPNDYSRKSKIWGLYYPYRRKHRRELGTRAVKSEGRKKWRRKVNVLNTYLIDLGLMVNREKGNRDIRKEERASKSVQFSRNNTETGIKQQFPYSVQL